MTLSSGIATDIVTVNFAGFGVELFGDRPPNPDVGEISRRLTEARLQSVAFDVPHPAERCAPEIVPSAGGRPIELWAQRAALAVRGYAGAGVSINALWADRRRPEPTTLPVPLAHCDLLRLRSSRLALDELFANANYFLFEPRELDTPFDAFGDPVGLVVANGVVHHPPQVGRACLCSSDGRVEIAHLAFDDVSITLPDGMRIEAHRRGAFDADGYRDGAVALARYFGASGGVTPADENVFEIVIAGRHAVAMGRGGAMPIPRTGCVLRFAGTPPDGLVDALRSGQPIAYGFRAGAVDEAVQAGPRIVHQGQVAGGADFFLREGMFAMDADGALQQPSPASWKADWHKTRAARLGAGIRADGSAFLLAIEGQSAFLPTGGRGASLHELAEQLLLEGAMEGIHLDGGGSTQLFRPYGGSLLRPGDFCRAFDDMLADYDRPLPLGLRVKLPNMGSTN